MLVIGQWERHCCSGNSDSASGSDYRSWSGTGNCTLHELVGRWGSGIREILGVPCPPIGQNSKILDFWLDCCRASQTEHCCSSTMFQYTSIHPSYPVEMIKPSALSLSASIHVLSWSRLNWSMRHSSQKETAGAASALKLLWQNIIFIIRWAKCLFMLQIWDYSRF